MFPPLFSKLYVDFQFLCEVMLQPLLAHKGPMHTVQNGFLHLHVNKITSDDIREYTHLSIAALIYVNFQQQRSVKVSVIFLLYFKCKNDCSVVSV